MPHRDRNIDNPLVAEHDAMDEAEAITTHTVDEANPHETEALGLERGADADQVEGAEASAIHTDTESAREASGDFADQKSDPPAGEAGIRNQRSENGKQRTENRERKTEDRRQKTANRRQNRGEQPRKARKQSSENSDQKPKKQPTNTAAKPQKTKAQLVKKQARSRRYLAAATQFDARRRYAPKEALELVQKTSTTKFDGAVEVHVRLAPKKGKESGERFRMVVLLPHGTGKEPKIGVLDEALIAKIKSQGDTEFAILLATPALMPKVAQIAKVLGPKGKMPNPKTGTVTDDPEAAQKAILSGRVEIRADAQHNLHQAIGRVSWPLAKLVENFDVLLAALPLARLQRVTVAATMGPGIEVELKK